MKLLKYFIVAGLLLLPLSKAKAAYDVESTLRDKSVTVLSTITVAANTGPSPVSTTTILVSLSSTSWPHSDRGAVHITNVQLMIDKVATSSGAIKMGVVTYVNQSSGTATYFMEKSFQKNISGTDNVINFNLDQASIRADVSPAANQAIAAGTTPFILSNDLITLSSTTLSRSVVLPAPTGNLIPGVGDIILTIINNDFGNTLSVISQVMYHTHPK